MTIRTDSNSLFSAVASADLAQVHLVLQSQPSTINQLGAGGHTPLHYAAFCGELEIVQLLLNNSANADIGNEHGITPLMYAASQGHITVLRTLLRQGAKPHQQDQHGDNALHWAMTGGDGLAVRELVRCGIPAWQKNFHGVTPLQVAQLNRRSDLVALFRHGSRRSAEKPRHGGWR